MIDRILKIFHQDSHPQVIHSNTSLRTTIEGRCRWNPGTNQLTSNRWPGFSGWTQCYHLSPEKWKERSESWSLRNSHATLACFEAGGRDCNPRLWLASRNWEQPQTAQGNRDLSPTWNWIPTTTWMNLKVDSFPELLERSVALMRPWFWSMRLS